jgi:hypothetical protein
VVKRYVNLRHGILVIAACLAGVLAMNTPAHAADAAKAAKADKKAKTEAKAAPAKAADAPKPKVASAPKAPKVKEAPKPKAPEKSYEEQKAEDGMWAKRTNWVSFRAGYAKNSNVNAGDGMFGYGVAYQRMISKKWSFGGSVQHDILGQLGVASEIAVPFTLEMQRHYKWHTAMRPYLGFGGGYYFHKYYRTGDSYGGAPGSGFFIDGGTNVPLDGNHLIGLDTRVSFVNGRTGIVNPVFGGEKATQIFYSIKLNWALAY